MNGNSSDYQMNEPLTQPDCDLRDFAFMPLDVIRLRDSDLAATESPDACWAAVLLWCASWHQVPAASLPDDDRVLANLAGFGRVVKEWQKLKSGALRGWVKCSDGRLYHPVIAEKAIEAWRGKQERQWRTECARIKKHAQRHEIPYLPPEFNQWLSDGCPQGQVLHVPRDINNNPQGQVPDVPDLSLGKTTPKGKGQGKGQGQYIKPSEANASGGEPPKLTNPDEIIFGYGVPLLVSAGASDKTARSFLGGLRKGHGDTALIDKLRECIKRKPLQPLEWLAAALPPGGSKSKSPPLENFANRDYGSGVQDL